MKDGVDAVRCNDGSDDTAHGLFERFREGRAGRGYDRVVYPLAVTLDNCRD